MIESENDRKHKSCSPFSTKKPQPKVNSVTSQAKNEKLGVFSVGNGLYEQMQLFQRNTS